MWRRAVEGVITVTIHTIGYEGADLSQFLDALLDAGIEHVIDVRAVPISRKPGFSKSKLNAALVDVGIEYSHLQALGDPKEGREAMRRGNYSEFLKIFSKHMSSVAAQLAVNVVSEIAIDETVALLCYENNPKECHRSIVAQHISENTTLPIRHLQLNLKSSSKPSPAKLLGLGQLQVSTA